MLGRDEVLGDDPGRGPEESALHIDEPGPTPAEDPGRAEVDLADHVEEALSASYFSDEEPEGPSGNGSVRPDGHVEDLEEILETQHYAFAPEASGAVGRGEGTDLV